MKVFLKSLIAIIIIQLVIIKYTYAQKPDTIIARVYYSYEHILDTTNKTKVYKEDMLLALGKSASVYTSLSKIYQTHSLEQQEKEQLKNTSTAENEMMPVIRYKASRYTTSTEYYKFNDEKKIFIKENLVRDYLYEDEFPKINWQITTDTASFKGILCQKALAIFKGRNWIAWFTTELPFQDGPWLLTGLPGLIIEAYDDMEEVAFRFSGFEKANLEDLKTITLNDFRFKQIDFSKYGIIMLPVERTALNAIRVVRATKQDILKLKIAITTNYGVFYKAQMEASGGIDYNYEASQAYALKPKINNPIILKDN